MGESGAERFFLPLIAQFLEAQLFHHERGGYMGLDAEPVGHGAVRVGYNGDGLLVFSSRVLCDVPDRVGVDLVPCFWFYVCRQTRSDGFVVETTAMLDGLRNLDPCMEELRGKLLSAYEGGEPGDDTMEIGGPLELRVSLVNIEQPSDALYRHPSSGIRFEVWRAGDGADGAPPTFTHFTMPGIVPLLALAVALDETPTEDPPTFGGELDELVQDMESKQCEEGG